MNLLIEYFKSTNSQRDQEYLFCINQNIINPKIKKIFVFISDESILSLKSDKIEIVKSENRPTFLDLFKFCNENLNDEICIIANTDIFFDQSIDEINKFDFTNKFLALTRWDLFTDGKQWMIRYYDNRWSDCYRTDGTIDEEESVTTSEFSQDSWIFKSPIVIDERSNFLMGKPGCDNRIVQILHENGYDVRNPSKKLKTLHYHQTNFRTYNNLDSIPGPYLLIKATDDLDAVPKRFTIPNFGIKN